LYEVACFKLSTTRERSPTCSTLAERRLPWLISIGARPMVVTTPGKSSAMRAGD
jgi:hypothetical protein